MKRVLLIILLILVIGIIIISYILTNKTVKKDIATNDYTILNTVDSANVKEKQIILSSIVNGYSFINMSDSEVLVDNSDFIIIGTVKSIDGVVNYDPVAECYTMTQTVGMLKIDKVLNGNIKEKEVPFIRLGGIISLSEFEKSIPGQKVEKQGIEAIDKLTKEEKNNKYVWQRMDGDIYIEKNKTYLMYLKYDNDYNRYSVQFGQYGTREIDATSLSSDPNLSNSDTETLTSNEYKTVKVKNNTNGSYDTLDSVIPDKVKKNK